MSERATKRAAVAVGSVATLLVLGNTVLIVLARRELNNAEGDLLFSSVGTLVAGVLFPGVGTGTTVRGVIPTRVGSG